MFREAIILVGLLAISSPVFAQNRALPHQHRGFQVGGSVGPSFGELRITDGPFEIKGDDNSYGYKVFAGYRFNRNWAAEVSYTTLGTLEGELVSGLFESFRPDLYSGTIVASIPLNNVLALHARAGVSVWDVRLDETFLGFTTSYRDTYTGGHLGVGASLAMNTAQFRLEYDVWRISEGVDTTNFRLTGSMLSFGVVFLF